MLTCNPQEQSADQCTRAGVGGAAPKREKARYDSLCARACSSRAFESFGCPRVLSTTRTLQAATKGNVRRLERGRSPVESTTRSSDRAYQERGDRVVVRLALRALSALMMSGSPWGKNQFAAPTSWSVMTTFPRQAPGTSVRNRIQDPKSFDAPQRSMDLYTRTLKRDETAGVFACCQLQRKETLTASYLELGTARSPRTVTRSRKIRQPFQTDT